jgi:hypothetical protein
MKAVFDAVREGTVDILIGTQMLSKGHDYPKLTLVGIVDPTARSSAPTSAPPRSSTRSWCRSRAWRAAPTARRGG